MPHAAGNFSPTDPSESSVFSFDFTPALSTGETIVGIPAWTIAVFTDSVAPDPAPNSRFIGSPGITGNITSQMVGNCLPDVVYTLSASATTSAGQIRTVSAEVACIRIW